VAKYTIADGQMLMCDGQPVAWIAYVRGGAIDDLKALAQTIAKALNVYGQLGLGVCTCDQAGNFCLAHPNCKCGCPRGAHDSDRDLNPYAGACDRGRLDCYCTSYCPNET